MKKTLLITALLFFFSSVFSQGKLMESLTLNSRILGKAVKYSIYLPENYDSDKRRFPVLYLLHGYTDNETGWTQFGEVKRLTDHAITSGDATSMLIVMPDAGVTFYMNDYGGKERYEDFFIKELIPFIDSSYNTRASKEFRAVSGLSMGGHGSLIYALKYPELFSSCAPLSAAVWTDEEFSNFPENDWNNFWGKLIGPDLNGSKRINDHYKKNMTLPLVKAQTEEKLKSVRYYIDCGDKDFLIKGNMALHAALIDKKIPHEFRVREGVHDWTYWRTALPEVLKFVSKGFHR